MVQETINSLKSKNSCGFDGISTKLIKSIAPALLKPLTLLMNQILNTGIIPDKFKKDDPSLFTNYRPISLLPGISKIIEKIVFNQLSVYFKLKIIYRTSVRF